MELLRELLFGCFFSSLKLIIGLIGAVLLNANLKGRSIFRVLVMPPG